MCGLEKKILEKIQLRKEGKIDENVRDRFHSFAIFPKMEDMLELHCNKK